MKSPLSLVARTLGCRTALSFRKRKCKLPKEKRTIFDGPAFCVTLRHQRNLTQAKYSNREIPGATLGGGIVP